MTSKKVIRVGGVPEHFNLPWHLAIEAKAFSELDIEVKFVECPGGTGEMTSALTDETLDIGLLLFEGAITNILRGHTNRIVKVFVESPLIWGIHVAANSKFQSVDDVQDGVYAISRAGSGSHLIAIVDAAERGWPTKDMKFSKIGHLDGAREKLAAGLVDVFLWERFMTQPLVDNGEFRRIDERIVPWPAFVVSAREEILDSQGTQIRKMLQIVNGYCSNLMCNPNAVELIAERYGLTLSETEKWFKLVEWNLDFDCPRETIERIIGYLERVNIIESNGAAPNDVWFDISK